MSVSILKHTRLKTTITRLAPHDLLRSLCNPMGLGVDGGLNSKRPAPFDERKGLETSRAIAPRGRHRCERSKDGACHAD